MKILLNGLSVVYPISGVGQYTLQLGKALEALLGDGNVFWFGNNVSGYGHGYSDHKGANFINGVRHHVKKGLREVPGLKTLVHLWRNNQFRSYVQGITPSLYHETNYTPFSFDQGPTIITLFDVSFVRHPEWHPKGRVRYLEKYCLKRLCDIEAIITISEFSKKEIMNLLGVHAAKIYVTPLGVDCSFTPGERRMGSFPDHYILFLGNLEPRKNLVRLLAAYRSLPGSLRRRFPLVIAGASGWHTHELKKALRQFQKSEKPILTGYVSQELLPDLYRGASLFVYPSLYEGFGLPPLEAMACGVPVITSNCPSLSEGVGDAAVEIDPYRVEELAEGMNLVLSNESLQGEMKEKGLKRAQMFSWEKTAKKTLQAYEEILEENK